MASNGSKSLKNDLIKLSLTLGLITLFVAAVLALINAVTAPKIEEIKQQKLAEAIAVVMPGAAEYEDVSENVLASWTSNVPLVTAQIARDTNGEIIGYCVEVQPKGYSDIIDMMVGVNASGEIVDSSIISISDTPGIGSQVATDPDFAAQFKGKTQTANTTLISGATYSSTGFTNGINAALAAYRIMAEEGTK